MASYIFSDGLRILLGGMKRYSSFREWFDGCADSLMPLLSGVGGTSGELISSRIQKERARLRAVY